MGDMVKKIDNPIIKISIQSEPGSDKKVNSNSLFINSLDFPFFYIKKRKEKKIMQHIKEKYTVFIRSG